LLAKSAEDRYASIADVARGSGAAPVAGEKVRPPDAFNVEIAGIGPRSRSWEWRCIWSRISDLATRSYPIHCRASTRQLLSDPNQEYSLKE